MTIPLATQEILCQQPLTVAPSQDKRSGWHSLISQTYVVERWFWDAGLRIWRTHPEAFEAETPFEMGCLGYLYLVEDQSDPPFQSGSAR